METWPAMDMMVRSLALDDPASLVIAVWREGRCEVCVPSNSIEIEDPPLRVASGGTSCSIEQVANRSSFRDNGGKSFRVYFRGFRSMSLTRHLLASVAILRRMTWNVSVSNSCCFSAASGRARHIFRARYSIRRYIVA